MASPTIRDVARAAGVSINTVSRALNDKPYVDPHTRQAVLEAAQKLRYVPNRSARRLRASKSGVFGVIVADIANPFFSLVVKGMGEAVADMGSSLILQDSNEDYQAELRAIETLRMEQVDSVLITPTRRREGSIDALRASGMPFVLVGRYFEDATTDYVIPDDEHAGYLATSHLLQRGHRRIALINGPVYNSSAADRRQGYERALNEQIGPGHPEWVREGALSIDDGHMLASSLLATTKPLPTAIFAFSDFVALGAIRAVREIGMRIPDDIAIVGCDDIPFASCLEVPLTTVRMPKREMGRMAIEIAGKKLDGETRTTQVKMPVELVERLSS